MLSYLTVQKDQISRSASFLAAIMLSVLLQVGCASSAPPTENVVVADFDNGQTAVSSAMTRQELEDHVRRFADRYITRIAIATRAVEEAAESIEVERFMADWRNVSYAAIVEVAIGPDAVTNLMDMMVLTMLSRMVVDGYWAPMIDDDELRAGFSQAFHDMEEDIWTVADDVLTSRHQAELTELVSDWHAENPEQVYPWYVRLSNFSGQRSASLEAVQQSGGLLVEVARAREAAEEIQAFGERVLFYLQRAPMITSGQFESSAHDVIGGPEVTQLISDMERFVVAVDRMVAVVEALPQSRIVAVDQMMDRVAEEREALVADLTSGSPEVRQLVRELLPLMQSVERTIVAATADAPGDEPIDIAEYRAIVQDSAQTATELRLLAESVSNLMAGVENVSGLTDTLIEVETALLDRFFLRMVGFLVFFFLVLLVSRFVWVRMSPG